MHFIYFSYPGVVQPLSMLLKLSPAVTKLNLYDIVYTPGVAADLSHIETKAITLGLLEQISWRLVWFEAEIVVIPAGIPHKPGILPVGVEYIFISLIIVFNKLGVLSFYLVFLAKLEN